jgi:hypothetical protein
MCEKNRIRSLSINSSNHPNVKYIFFLNILLKLGKIYFMKYIVLDVSGRERSIRAVQRAQCKGSSDRIGDLTYLPTSMEQSPPWEAKMS